MSRWVAGVYGIVVAEGVDVQAAVKEDWILADPAARLRIIPAAAEFDETGVGVVKPALEPKRLEAGVGVAQDTTEGVIVEALHDFARLRVHDEANRVRRALTTLGYETTT